MVACDKMAVAQVDMVVDDVDVMAYLNVVCAAQSQKRQKELADQYDPAYNGAYEIERNHGSAPGRFRAVYHVAFPE